MRAAWLFVLLLGCSAQPAEIGERHLYGISQRISTDILMTLTRPKLPEYEFGLVNEPGGFAMMIPAANREESVVLLGGLLWAQVVEELSAHGSKEEQIHLRVPRREIRIDECEGLHEALVDFRSEISASLKFIGVDADVRKLTTGYLDGPSYLIQTPLRYGTAYLRPASWANERLHKVSYAAQVLAAKCSENEPKTEVDYYF